MNSGGGGDFLSIFFSKKYFIWKSFNCFIISILKNMSKKQLRKKIRHRMYKKVQKDVQHTKIISYQCLKCKYRACTKYRLGFYYLSTQYTVVNDETLSISPIVIPKLSCCIKYKQITFQCSKTSIHRYNMRLISRFFHRLICFQ